MLLASMHDTRTNTTYGGRAHFIMYLHKTRKLIDTTTHLHEDDCDDDSTGELGVAHDGLLQLFEAPLLEDGLLLFVEVILATVDGLLGAAGVGQIGAAAEGRVPPVGVVVDAAALEVQLDGVPGLGHPGEVLLAVVLQPLPHLARDGVVGLALEHEDGHGQTDLREYKKGQ